jgi:hypothetical protein
LRIGIILKTKLSNKVLVYKVSSHRKSSIPSSTNEAGVSPGCTLEVIKIVGFSNLSDLGFFSGKHFSI